MPINSNVTMREVARYAGVSHQTVSRVINGSDRVRPETRQRVQAAIQALGYRPNASAQFLATGRPLTIACLAPNLTDYTFASIIEGATTESRQHGYFIISASAPDEAIFADLIDQLIATRRAEGLIVINPYIDQRYNHLPRDVATVFVGARQCLNSIHCVSIDNEAAGYLATEHLLKLGHQQIAQITGPLKEDCSQDRLSGYEQALMRFGLKLDPQLVVEGDWSASSGYKAVLQWLERATPFTAIMAQNDRMAVGAIRALREAGKRVPEEISVIGCDDMPLSSYFDPPLTTIRQDMLEIGQQAVRLLIRSIENPNSECQHLRLPVKLIVRHSTQKLSK